MNGLRDIGKHLPKVSDFYHGKSILVTGSTGFVGSILVQKLLKCCPGIESIYIHLRSKKNVKPEDRKEQIFNKKLFERLKEENRTLLDKVQVIPGDVSLPNLGMSEKDIQQLTEKVSVVFHCAASISFEKTVRFSILNIVSSLNKIIEISQKMKKFESLIFTSTAYSNCNQTSGVLKEEICRLPYPAETFLDALKNENDEMLEKLFNNCKPIWPNPYVFSKCVAENLILEKAADIPVAIIRPSIIYSTWKNPIRGYEEGKSAISQYFIGVGKGFFKYAYADPKCKLDLVPVDIVANTHILAACYLGTKRCSSPLIVNCTAEEKLITRISDYQKITKMITHKFPLPLSIMKPTHSSLVTNKYLYFVLVAYHHYLPAIVFDGILKIIGKKPWLYYRYRFLDSVLYSASFFLFHTFEFQRDGFENLNKLIHPEDRKELDLDFKDATALELTSTLPEASAFYDFKMDKKTPLERQRIKYRYHIILNGIKWMISTASICSFIWIFSLIFL